jgi:hypothetical protein
MADNTPNIVFDFSGTDAAKEWQTINDFLLGDKKAGPFKLEIEWIKVVRAGALK